ALTDEYAIPRLEAAELEKDLYLSFVKFRAPRERLSIRAQGPDLLVTACREARDYQRHRLQTLSLLPDERLARLLAREPSEVARERFALALETLTDDPQDV
ncbi:MAG: hypothetical protein ACRDSJ_10705, partial [Rubrobacteraceae bacterium]